MMRSVVITGVGTIGPHGGGLDGLRAALASGETPLRDVDACDFPTTSRLALFQEGDLSPWLPARAARRLSPSSKYAVAAARQAIENAGSPDDGRRTLVRLGVSFGPSSVTEKLLDQILRADPRESSPMLFMESVANAPAGQVAMALDLRGPNAAIAQREAAGLLAFVGGVSDVATGRCDRALVGAVDEITPLTHGILDRFGALATECGELSEAARPFSANRNGMVISEGCTTILLEDEAVARDRGAPILAKIAATARANDPTAPTHSWGRGGKRLAQSLATRLVAQGVDVPSIEQVVSSASGSLRGDRLEADWLRALFAKSRVPHVVAPKSVTGEYGGGYLAAALLAAGGAAVAAPRDFAVDPRLGIEVAAAGRACRTLISATAAGGAAAWVVVDPV